MENQTKTRRESFSALIINLTYDLLPQEINKLGNISQRPLLITMRLTCWLWRVALSVKDSNSDSYSGTHSLSDARDSLLISVLLIMVLLIMLLVVVVVGAVVLVVVVLVVVVLVVVLQLLLPLQLWFLGLLTFRLLILLLPPLLLLILLV